MAEVKTEQEPSIEEILESIRQIISEDGETGKPAAVKPVDLTPAAAPALNSDLDLSSVKEPASSDAGADILDLVELVNPEPPAQEQPLQPQPVSVAAEAKMDQPMTDEADNLMSPQTAQVVTEELSKILASNMAIEKEEVGRTGKVTLEDMTRELMKPMIKAWIDQNLPGIIEKIVQKEVEKLSRRVMDR